MTNHDTMLTNQPSLTTTEIMTILLGCEQILRFVQASPNYRDIEASERFSTSNDLRLGDAVQALMEIHQAILDIEFYSQVIASFTKTIIAEIAVLKRIPSRSSVTFLMHACSVFNCAGVAATSLMAALSLIRFSKSW